MRVVLCAAVSSGTVLRSVFKGIALAVVLGAAAAHAQTPRGGPDLNVLALDWARGQYRAPMVCEFEGGPQRVVRRVLIAPAPLHETILQDRVEFPDPEAPGVKRCFSELGPDEPFVAGTVAFTLRERARPDIAQHDFEALLRRDHGFEFEVLSGHLKVGAFAPGGDPPRDLEFAGGKARLHLLEPGSDAARLLSEFRGMPAYTLELDSPDGTHLVFHVVRIAER